MRGAVAAELTTAMLTLDSPIPTMKRSDRVTQILFQLGVIPPIDQSVGNGGVNVEYGASEFDQGTIMLLRSIVFMTPFMFILGRRSWLERGLDNRCSPGSCFTQAVCAEEEVQLERLVCMMPIDSTQFGIEEIGQKCVDKFGRCLFDRQDFASGQYRVKDQRVGRYPFMGEVMGVEEPLYPQLASAESLKSECHPLDVYRAASER